ncbi:hypothetical protein [Kitasatospora viridis]|uniref:Uncharacterized protein n=1 Tax=Kitasatospora viridis TaxID=281105 RepID=A0A561TSC3_9ACTN|nr:hypothetical protein [Kitasatospora viridis]TWF90013.1 hypothetical protein FHX73_1357 [Kitasatospora viridis]
MSTWASVSNLSVTLRSGGQDCHIYANGQNRIAVAITVEPTDEDGNPVQVDLQHLAENLWLIDYDDESKLDWNGYSGWAYTDAANEFTATPDGVGERAESTIEDDGAQCVTFYVYGWPGVSRKSIGVRVKTDSGATVSSSRGGAYQSRVTFSPRSAVTYTWGDITWDCSRASTREGGNTGRVTTDAWNYYLSLKAEDNYFVAFRVQDYASEPGYDGLFACRITPEDGRRNFYGGYVWYREPHDRGTGRIVNFPDGNDWCDDVAMYDRADPERYLCFTWVHATIGGDGWHIPNGPVNDWKWYYSPKIVAWDRYGNAGTFWVYGDDIVDSLKGYDHPQ